MSSKLFSRNAIEFGLLAAVISLAAVTAFEAQQFTVAALCLLGTVVCSRRLGQLATAHVRQRAEAAGQRVRVC